MRSHMITVTSWFSEIFVLKLKRQTSVLKSPGLKSDLEKLCLRDGIVWTAGRTVNIKLCYQISRATFLAGPK